MKKRKPEIVKQEKSLLKESKSDKKTVIDTTKQGIEPHKTLFEGLTLKIKDKKMKNKKITQMAGLEEKMIDDLGLRGHIKLDLIPQNHKEKSIITIR